jgi:glyoxylase-like metal-dependent hydrolase (beta-lactamase superfamily II)
MPQPLDSEFAVDEVARDIARLRIAMVNVYLVGPPADAAAGGAAGTDWVLVDAGLAHGAAEILQVAAQRFGVESRPAAIVLTHGHFDHVGALEALLAVWDVPVYAHVAELPFLTGRANFPPPDPTVGAGVLPRVAPAEPEQGIDLGNRVRALPTAGWVPGMPSWQWIHTPGHSPGHVSLFRPTDRVLLAGDAIATTSHTTVYSCLPQRSELAGPPAYLTIDWEKAEASTALLASLKPSIVAAGHGAPMQHPRVAAEVEALARDFRRRVRPTHGRYIVQPAFADEAHSALPASARASRVRWGAMSGVAAATFAGTWLYRRFGRR